MYCLLSDSSAEACKLEKGSCVNLNCDCQLGMPEGRRINLRINIGVIFFPLPITLL